MPEKPSLKALQEAGIDLDAIPADQRAALEDLSAEEISTLLNIYKKLDASREVVGLSDLPAPVGGIIF